MSSKLERAKKLGSAKVTETASTVNVKGFAELVAKLEAMKVANLKSQEAITKQLNQLSQVILMSSEEGLDITPLVEAIKSLEAKIDSKTTVAPNYVIEFDRDRNGLMKSGIELNVKQRRLN